MKETPEINNRVEKPMHGKIEMNSSNVGASTNVLQKDNNDKLNADIRMSSSGSPLLTGAHSSYGDAEISMEELFNKKALFFNSGFSANSGVISALATENNLPIILIGHNEHGKIY